MNTESLPGPSAEPVKQNAPAQPPVQLFAYTNADTLAGTSKVVAGQIFLNPYYAQVLFDSGATHSFISTRFAMSLSRPEDRTSRNTRTHLPSGDVLESQFVLARYPVEINGTTLPTDLIAIDIQDFDVILGMDFLSEHHAVIDCRHRRVTFFPQKEKKFAFNGRPLRFHRRMVNAAYAKRLLNSGCRGYLAAIVDKSKESPYDCCVGSITFPNAVDESSSSVMTRPVILL